MYFYTSFIHKYLYFATAWKISITLVYTFLLYSYVHTYIHTYIMYSLHGSQHLIRKPFFFPHMLPFSRRFPSSGRSDVFLSCNTVWLGLRGSTPFTPRVNLHHLFFPALVTSGRRAIFQTVSCAQQVTQDFHVAPSNDHLLSSLKSRSPSRSTYLLSISPQLVPGHLRRLLLTSVSTRSFALRRNPAR